MSVAKSPIRNLKSKIKQYVSLIKSLQTGLLLSTGLAGYMSARCPIFNIPTMLGLTVSLFLSISGSTVLNMWYDRDLDAKMARTSKRPLPAGKISPQEALRLGLVLSLLGIGMASAMDTLYGLIVFAGSFFDVIVYTVWLKRRTAWAIIWGGISGGMPILAGRALGVGAIDWIGIMLSVSVLFWIPTHVLTFSMKFHDDYRTAGVPTLPSSYGFPFTRATIAISSVFAALSIGLAAYGVGMAWGYLRVLTVLSAGLLILAMGSLMRPSERVNFGLFKYASLYMLSAMIILILQTFI